jgi:hypothetical protein
MRRQERRQSGERRKKPLQEIIPKFGSFGIKSGETNRSFRIILGEAYFKREPHPMRPETGVSWLDTAVNKANVPLTLDTETAIELHLRITGEQPAGETYRRFQIPYRLIGRERRYAVDDVVAFAKRRFEQAPRRVASRSQRRRVGAPAKSPSP